MMLETIDHKTLNHLTKAGVIDAAAVIGHASGWQVEIRHGTTKFTLTAQHGKARSFRKMETVIDYLKKLGIARFEVDAINYDSEQLKLSRVRPDRTQALKRAYQAATYELWFREQVLLSLKDHKSNIPHHKVMERLEMKIKQLKSKRAKNRVAA